MHLVQIFVKNQDESSQYIVNIGVLDNIKSKKVTNEDKLNSESAQEKYIPPDSWYYKLELANEEK